MPPPPSSLLSTPTPTPTIQFDSGLILVASSFPSLPSAVNLIQNNADLLDVVTTTVFVDTGATMTTKPSSSSKVPIGAIVGGLLGGISIALLTVGGWIWWGKVIERKAKKDRERSRRTSTSSIKRENGSRHVSGSLNDKTNGRESARTSKRSLQQGVHPLMAAATGSQKSVSFADDETASAAVNRDGSEVKISISIAEKEKLADSGAEKDIGKAIANPPARGFSIRGPSPTPPPPARRSHSSERGYLPTRRSPLSQDSRSPSPSPGLSSRRRTPSAPQPGTGESLSNTVADGGLKSSPPGARSLSTLPSFGSKGAERENEGLTSPLTNTHKLFLTRTPISKGHGQNENHNIQSQSSTPTVSAPTPTRVVQPAIPPSPAKASVSLSLPGGTSLPSLHSLPLSPSGNPGSVNEALAALSTLDMSPLAQPRPAFRQGTYTTSSVTKTTSSGVSGASESLVSAPSVYSQDGTATDIDPRIANRR